MEFLRVEKVLKPEGKRRRQAEVQGIALALGEVGHLPLGVLTFEQDAPRVLHKLLALIGEGDALRRTDDQPDAEIRLKRLDRHGDGGLGNEQLLAGAGEIVIAVYRLQILQAFDIQHKDNSFLQRKQI